MPYISPKGTLENISIMLPEIAEPESQPSTPPSSPEESNWWTKAMENPIWKCSEEFTELTTNVWACSKEGEALAKRALAYLWASHGPEDGTESETVAGSNHSHLEPESGPKRAFIFLLVLALMGCVVAQLYRTYSARRSAIMKAGKCTEFGLKKGKVEEEEERALLMGAFDGYEGSR